MKIQKFIFIFIVTLTFLSFSLYFLHRPVRAAVSIIQVSTTDDVVAVDGECSLREAIISANTNPMAIVEGECKAGQANETDVIVLQNGEVYALTIDGLDVSAQTGDLDISNDPAGLDLELRVANNGNATIDATAINDRVLEIIAATVVITGITIQNGSSSTEGGGIRSSGVLTLYDSTVAYNNAAAIGGGISNSNELTLINSEVSANQAIDGGGIYNSDGARLTITESRIQENFGTGVGINGGGGIYNGTGGVVVIEDSTINLNETSQEGDGAGIYNSRGIITVTNTLFEANQTEVGIIGGLGGAIYSGGSDAVIRVFDATFHNNNQAVNGGAIYNDEFSGILLETSLLQDNSAGISGGAIYNRGIVALLQTTVYRNQAAQGGGIYSQDGTVAIAQQSNIYSNTATAMHGGGLYFSGSGLVMANSSLISNTAANSGGGAFIQNIADIFFANVTIGGNSAASQGGGLYVTKNETALRNVTLAENRAGSGAALYTTPSGAIELSNSIVSAQAGFTCLNSQGDFTSKGHNIFSDNTCTILIPSDDLFATDPQLKPMSQQQGTFLFKPEEDSPAVDSGDAALCAGFPINNVDQVGEERPVGDACDRGAVEYKPSNDVYLPLIIR